MPTNLISQITQTLVGNVTDKMGSTFNERDGKTEEVLAGYELQMADFLQTGEDGAMNILFKDGTKVTLAPNTEFVIDEFAFDTDVIPIKVAMAIDINVGSFTYESGQVKKLGGEVNILTPTASITVQGTALTGTVEQNGATTITLLPDSAGKVGQINVSNEAGTVNLNRAYSSITVVATDILIKPPKVLTPNVINDLFGLETNSDDIEEKNDNQKNRKSAFDGLERNGDDDGLERNGDDDGDYNDGPSENNEDGIITNSDDGDTAMPESSVDIGSSGTEATLDVKSSEEIAVDQSLAESTTDIDTSYYDDFEADLKEWGYIDENDEISVWDADGEKTMDWEDAKKMYSEMDQAYFDAIGCETGCNYDTIDWETIDWEAVDWEAYDEAYNDTLEKYGLTSYDMKAAEVDVVAEVEQETEAGSEGYSWEDFYMDDAYYSNAAYASNGGPPTLTVENYCQYNDYDSGWCNQEYIEYLNDYYKDDWTLKVTETSWTDVSKKIWGKMYGWCGSWPDYELCEDQPKPWKIKNLKTKYISDWTWEDWDHYWDVIYDWYYYGIEYDDGSETELTLEEEYAFEDDFDIDPELVEWLANIDNEWDCEWYGYYWDAGNSACGTEYVEQVVTKTNVTGEVLNFETGEVTQTTETSGLTVSSTTTGRLTTTNNDDNASITVSGNYSIVDRTLGSGDGSHRAYVKVETAEKADIQIMQNDGITNDSAGVLLNTMEAQNLKVGESGMKITIIQSN